LKKDNAADNANAFAKYAGMGMQMACIIGIGMFAGIKMDEFAGWKKVPVFTLSLSLFSVFAAIYYFIKDFLKDKK